MSYDRNSDAEETSAWPGTQPPFSAPVPPAVPQTGAQAQPWQQPTAQPSPSGWVPPTPPGQAPGAPFTGYGQPQTPQMPTPATESGGSKKGILAAVAVVVVLAVGGAGFYFWTPISDKLLGQSSTTSSATSSATTTSPPPPSTTATSSAPAPSAAAPGPGAAATPAPSAPPKAAAPVDPADLQSYLATADALSTRFGGADMQPVGLGKQPMSDIDASPFKCSGAAVPGASQAWSGSGFTGFVQQVVNDSAGAHKFVQTLGTFRTPEAAKAFVDSQLSQWQGCANTDLTITPNGGKSDHATLGAVATTDGVNTIVLTPPAVGSRQCERAMTSSSNVVIDVRACAVNVGTTGSAIARDISQKIAGPR